MNSLLGVLEYTKIMIDRFSNADGIAIDMTLGKGYDSEYLSTCFKKVVAFDIQKEAISISKERLEEYKNINYINDSHDNIDKYINYPVDLVIYNLGYLPKCNESITTVATSTVSSLKKVLVLLKKKGIVIITIYPGHPEGKKEAIELNTYFKTLLGDKYQLSKYEILNKEHAPYVVCIKKK